MIGHIWNLIIENCGRRVDNLIPKNIEKILLDFWLIANKKNYHNLNWIIMFLLLVLVINLGVDIIF